MKDGVSVFGRDFTAGKIEDLPVCIVGTGPAGRMLAGALAEKGIPVLLLEAGTEAPSDPTDAGVGVVDVTGEADLQYMRAVQLGGSSNLWAGRVAPLEPIDLADRSWVPDGAWPVTRADLEPYYARVYKIMDLQRPAPIVAPDSLPPLDGGLEIKTFAWVRPPFRIADYLADVLPRLPNLRILTNAAVTSLRPAEDGRSLRSIVAVSPEGQTVEIFARQFVLASGGLSIPRLLLSARDGAGIGNDHDQVGRYLSTHPKADMASLVLNRSVSVRHPLFMDSKNAAGTVLRGGIGFSEAVQREKKLLNHYVQLAPMLEYKASKLFDAVKSSGAASNSLINKSEYSRGFVAGLGLWAFDYIGKIAGLQNKARIFILRAFLDQYPDADNRIRLSAETDRFGVPKADILWRFGQGDRQSVLDFFTEMDARIRAMGIGRVLYDRLQTETDWPIVGIHSHFLGTTRMGTDPRRSVVNGDLRVHDMENLYLSGPSVFPSYGYANPFLTISALSLRLADHMAKTI